VKLFIGKSMLAILSTQQFSSLKMWVPLKCIENEDAYNFAICYEEFKQ
jgi:hypothetical protein